MTERIGDMHGRIALYLDKQGALDLAATFGPSDAVYDELMDAVRRAYPEEEDGDEPCRKCRGRTTVMYFPPRSDRAYPIPCPECSPVGDEVEPSSVLVC